jgi:acyl-CoA synthetase (AMP-forming)/AMP-acid ligase II
MRLNDDAASEPAIKVLMDRDRLVVRPIGHLDQGSIETLVSLLGCAREAGVIAVLDLDAIEPDDLAGSDVLARLVADASSSFCP